MAIVAGNTTLERICEALGIDHKKTPVRRITMDFPLYGVAEVTVHRLLKTDELDGVIAVLSDDGVTRHVEFKDLTRKTRRIGRLKIDKSLYLTLPVEKLLKLPFIHGPRWNGDVLEMVLSHPSLEEVPDGCIIPEITPRQFEDIWREMDPDVHPDAIQ